MMTREEKLVEAKLIAVENKFRLFIKTFVTMRTCDHLNLYEEAKDLLQAITDVEIEDELKQHEANLLIASENKPE